MQGVVIRVLDHSLRCWEVLVDGVTEVKKEENEGGMVRRFRVPDGYLEGGVERVRRLRNKVMDALMQEKTRLLLIKCKY